MEHKMDTLNFEELSIEQLVNVLLSCRAKKDQIQEDTKSRLAKLEEMVSVLESELRQRKEQQGLERISTEAATIFWVQNKTVKVLDWSAFFEYAKDYPEFFTKSPAKKAVLEAIDNGEVIPGLMIDSIISMNVRKK
jgi:hypothetical protein